MKKDFRVVGLYCGLLIVLLAVGSYAQKWGKVSFVVGDVSVARGSRSRVAKLNLGIKSGDEISTAVESSVDITKNGDGSLVKVLENSKVKITDNGTETAIGLVSGEIIGNIKKLVATKKMYFYSPTATATIRGTAFSFKYRKESKQTELNVFEGVVEFKSGDKIVSVSSGRRVVSVGGEIKETPISKKEMKRVKEKSGDALSGVPIPKGVEEDKIIEEVKEVKEDVTETVNEVRETGVAGKILNKTLGNAAVGEPGISDEEEKSPIIKKAEETSKKSVVDVLGNEELKKTIELITYGTSSVNGDKSGVKKPTSRKITIRLYTE